MLALIVYPEVYQDGSNNTRTFPGLQPLLSYAKMNSRYLLSLVNWRRPCWECYHLQWRVPAVRAEGWPGAQEL